MLVEVPVPLQDFDLAKVGRRGLRTFHLEAGFAGRAVSPPASVDNEAISLELGAPLGIAPPLIDVDPDATWIRERLIDGTDLRFECGTDKAVVQAINQILLPLWDAAPLEMVGRTRYLRDIATDIAEVTRRARASRIERRLDSAVHRLMASARQTEVHTVPVTWSHGDLAAKNLVVRPDGSLVAIDWEYAAPRSPALDVFLMIIEDRADRLSATRQVNVAAVAARQSDREAIQLFFGEPGSAFSIAVLEILQRSIRADYTEDLVQMAERGVAIAEGIIP